ncbi:MAG: rhomboid family intramembrane serine protease [Planctomycetes bacterium]|nr:rhomboid family intramembrane serine protease [Planctomycetota bacterium]
MGFEDQVRRSPLDDYPLSIGLLIACAAIFGVTDLGLMGERGASLKEWGMNSGAGLERGEYWRLVTSMFLHGGVVHILLNGWVLWQLCPPLERDIGTARFAAIWFGAGIAGSLASSCIDAASVGASGAIFGVLATWLRVFRVRRGSWRATIADPIAKQFLLWTVLNLVLGFTIPRISNAAHIGGMVGGWMISAALMPALKGFERGRMSSKPSIPKLAVAIALLVVAGVVARFNTWNSHILLRKAVEAAEAGRTAEAVELVGKAKRIPFGQIAEEYAFLGEGQKLKGRWEVAEALFRGAEEKGDDSPDTADNLALVYQKLGKKVELLAHLRKWKERGAPLKGWEAELAALEEWEKREKK